MAFTVVAWRESLDAAGAFNALTAVSDPHVFTSGDDIRVPEAMRFIVGISVLINDLTVVPRARITSPSLRAMFNPEYSLIQNGLVHANNTDLSLFPGSPIPIMPAEAINVEVLQNPAAAVENRALVWISDGPITPVSGQFFTVRATGATAVTANVWTNITLTFSQTLPVGRYQVVGMRGESDTVAATTLIAQRLVFPGGIWRPGVPTCNLQASRDFNSGGFRMGRFGVFGEFHTNAPPTLDVLADADSDSVVFLDLLKVG